MTKSTKSQQGGLTPSSFRTSVRRARVSRASRAWQVRAAKDKVKIGDFAALRNFNYTTRANISHEKAEQIRARIVCTPAEKEGRAWGKSVRRRKQGFLPALSSGELTDLRSKRGRRRRDGVEGGARSVTDEVSFVKKT